MPKTYIVDDGNAARPMIDDLAPGGDLHGPPLALDQGIVQLGKGIVGPGRDMVPFRNSLGARRCIYTTGLGHCFGFAVVWGKLGDQFEYGYCAHISNLQRRQDQQAPVVRRGLIGGRGGQVQQPQNDEATAFDHVLEEIGMVAQHQAWVAVSMRDSGSWRNTLVQALTGVGIADNHIWLYQREFASNSFGVDRWGRFGIAPGVAQ